MKKSENREKYGTSFSFVVFAALVIDLSSLLRNTTAPHEGFGAFFQAGIMAIIFLFYPTEQSFFTGLL